MLVAIATMITLLIIGALVAIGRALRKSDQRRNAEMSFREYERQRKRMIRH